MSGWIRSSCLAVPLAVASAGLSACDSRRPTEPTPIIEPEAPGPTSDEMDVAAARPTVDAWLELIDSGRYRDAWQLGSTYFQRVVSADDLVRAMETHRAPLGEVDTRALRETTRTDTLPGAPDAPYVVFSFQTVFADRTTAVETVTAEREGDAWLIAGHVLTEFGQTSAAVRSQGALVRGAARPAAPVTA
ncbi:MAG: DUF4019 domain-containing protein [Acidobacteria bacterium]|nr:DUF4019 domain-containing protein [Acidobacteriota bacterium]